MKIPYAAKWQKETDKLRKIALACGLTEEIKWGKPCLTYKGKNVAIVIPLKDACAFSFFKGALLSDPKHTLQRIGQARGQTGGSDPRGGGASSRGSSGSKSGGSRTTGTNGSERPDSMANEDPNRAASDKTS